MGAKLHFIYEQITFLLYLSIYEQVKLLVPIIMQLIYLIIR